MHYYLKEYFDELYEVFQNENEDDVGARTTPYSNFCNNAMFYLDDETLSRIANKYSLLNDLMLIDRNRKGFLEPSWFYGSYDVLVNYEKDLDILLRKDKVKKLLNGLEKSE